MTDREKLIALFEKAIARFTVCNSDGKPVTDYPARMIVEDCDGLLADYLLDNGVTFAKDTNVPSKWIPVTEETPEESTNVLLRIKSKTTGMMAVTVGYCYTYYWCHQPVGLRWFERWRASHEPAGGKLDESWDVTHWMKLPKDPREEAE